MESARPDEERAAEARQQDVPPLAEDVTTSPAGPGAEDFIVTSPEPGAEDPADVPPDDLVYDMPNPLAEPWAEDPTPPAEPGEEDPTGPRVIEVWSEWTEDPTEDAPIIDTWEGPGAEDPATTIEEPLNIIEDSTEITIVDWADEDYGFPVEEPVDVPDPATDPDIIID